MILINLYLVRARHRKRGQIGLRNGFWKGGRSVASNGYVLIRVGTSHPLADVRGYAYEHRVVATKKIGRPLRRGEHVHHIDGNKQNNSPENLEVLTTSEHGFEHRESERGLRKPGEENPIVKCACGCNERFSRYDSSGRPRAYVSGHNPQNAPTCDAVTCILKDGEYHVNYLAAVIGTTPASVASALSKLKKCGAVESDGRGRWRYCG